MHSDGKEATHQEPGKSSLSSTENGSLLIATLKLKKGIKVSDKQTSKLKSKSHLKSNRSVHSKPLGKKTSVKRIVRKSASKKVIGEKILKKVHDKQATKKLVSSNLQQKVSSTANHIEDEEIANEVYKIKKSRKRKKKRKKKDEEELDEPLRFQRRTRYLMIKMKLEQNLIDAYSMEGWKGQSREKIKPERELLRAKKQILNCKLRLRDAIHQLDQLSKVGSIADSVIFPDGSVRHEHIFCSKCKSNEVSPDNDIVLCDGMCNSAFHQKCLDPPLHTESIPPGDQEWFCKYCECRIEIIESMNAHLGTHFSVNCNWKDIFKEEADFPDGGKTALNPEEEWPSDDSKDMDYDPERKESSVSGAGTDDDASDSDSSSTSLGWSSDGELFSGSRKLEMDVMDFRNPSIYSSIDSDESSDEEIVCGPRQRRKVDYKKLYDEMFGKDAPAHEQVTEDEDWGPAKRKRREKESDAASTLMTLFKSEKKAKKQESPEMKEKPRDLEIRRSCFRIPSHAIKKLREVFADNELPSRAVKENLSKELGLDPGKVGKWFKNARYMALKLRKADGAKELNNSLKAKPSDFSATDNTRAETGRCSTKTSKNAHKRKNSKTITSSQNENQNKNEQERSALGKPGEINEVGVECSDDVSLRKLLKTKSNKAKRKVKFTSTEASLAAEADLERICRAKIRVENLKQKLTTLGNRKSRRKSNKTNLLKESVVYVPVAELKEKL